MFLRLGIKALRNDVVVVPRLKLARPRATVVFCLWMVESPMEVVVTPLKMEELPKETVVFPLAMEVLPTARAVLPSVMLVLPMEPRAWIPAASMRAAWLPTSTCEVKSQTKATATALNRSRHHVQKRGRGLFDHSLMLNGPSERRGPKGRERTGG